MEIMEKIKKLFKKAFNIIQKHGFKDYGEKMFNIVVYCLVTLSVFLGVKDVVFPYLNKANRLYIEGKDKSKKDNEIDKNQEIYPLTDKFEKILSKSKLITWKEANNIIKDNEGFYLHDVESKGIYINMKKDSLNDPLKIAKDISNKGHWGNGDYCVEINNEDDIDNIIPLIKQSLKLNKK